MRCVRGSLSFEGILLREICFSPHHCLELHHSTEFVNVNDTTRLSLTIYKEVSLFDRCMTCESRFPKISFSFDYKVTSLFGYNTYSSFVLYWGWRWYGYMFLSIFLFGLRYGSCEWLWLFFLLHFCRFSIYSIPTLRNKLEKSKMLIDRKTRKLALSKRVGVMAILECFLLV